MTSKKSKKATIYDIAEAAGVSIGTVSRVLNNRSDVAPETRERVLEASRKVKYMPMLTTRRVSIGLVVRQTSEIHQVAYVGTVLAALVDQATKRGAVLEIVPLDETDRVYTHYLQGVIGLVFGPGISRLRQIRHIPVVLINNMSERKHFHMVGTDHAEAARMGTAYLLKRGHRRIALVQLERKEWGTSERERGYREAFASAGAKVPEDLITYVESSSIEKAFDPILKKKPSAVFVSGEDLSIAITEALVHRLKVRIPEDLSLLTYEVPLLSRLTSPPLTTIEQPWGDMARTAVDEVLSLIAKGGKGLRQELLPNRLIERASVRSIPVEPAPRAARGKL